MNRLLVTLAATAALLSHPTRSLADVADSLMRKPTHYIGVGVTPSYVFPTNSFLKGTNAKGKAISTAFSANARYGFRFGRGTRLGRLYPNAVQGVGISYNTFFNNGELGSPVAVYIYQTARIARLSGRLSLDYEWNFGAAFGWKKYDEDTNHYNTAIGSTVNAYMGVGLLLDWRIAPCTSLTAGVTAAHYSNGNTAYPNAGVNTVGLAVGVTRTIGGDKDSGRWDDTPPTAGQEPFKRHVSYDITAYWAMRKRAVYPADGTPGMAPGSFAVAGLNFTPLYNFNKYLRAGLSLDMQYDESANLADHVAGDGTVDEDVKFYRQPFIERISVGLSARVELVMPIFSIDVGVGRNIIYKGNDTDSFYQILALKADLTRNLFLHVGYELNKFKDPNNLMLGVGVRLNNRR